jgi:hypothetical protein
MLTSELLFKTSVFQLPPFSLIVTGAAGVISFSDKLLSQLLSKKAGINNRMAFMLRVR